MKSHRSLSENEKNRKPALLIGIDRRTHQTSNQSKYFKWIVCSAIVYHFEERKKRARGGNKHQTHFTYINPIKKRNERKKNIAHRRQTTTHNSYHQYIWSLKSSHVKHIHNANNGVELLKLEDDRLAINLLDDPSFIQYMWVKCCSLASIFIYIQYIFTYYIYTFCVS